MRCEIAKRSRPLIHRDRGTLIRVNEDHELKAPFSTAYGHMDEGPSANELRLEISRIASGSVETLDHTNAKIPKR
jgi:hypothetical protein